MKIADEYFNNCRKIAVSNPELNQKKVRYNIFTRENGIVVGSNKAVNFIKENTYGPIKIMGLKDGEEFESKQAVLIIEGNFTELVTLETTILGFLSFSGAASSMKEIVKAAKGIPVIDMSARHYPWQLIEELALAAYYGGASGTSTEAGFNYVNKWVENLENWNLYASLPHAMAAVASLPHAMAAVANHNNVKFAEKLLPSVEAARLFNLKFPNKPITILVDYEGRELDVATQAWNLFGDRLFAVRLDTHGDRYMQGIIKDSCIQITYYSKKGVTIEATKVMRNHLDSIGAKNVKIVVSSGFTKEKVETFANNNAPIDFIGTGSWVKFFIFTADITHVYENNNWIFRGKVGRNWDNNEKLPVLFERK